MTVLVTGGSTGIWAGIARTFRAHGARLIATGSTAAKLDWCAGAGVETPLTEELWTSSTIGPAIAARMAAKTRGKPEDVANGALLLASPAAAYITGTVPAADDDGYSIS
jgi:NAD(P)-dependent dehydrogenase (short-subunit alcohol dehydrogenase family)